MTLPSSGSLSLSQIQGEWGGSNPISLSEYYRGSLPNGRTNYGTIPSSGAIDIGDFYGTNAASASIQISSGNSFYQAAGQYTAEVRHHFRTGVVGITGYASAPTFSLNGRNTQYVGMNHSTGGYSLQLLDLANPTIIGQGTPSLGHPANSGWTSVTLAGNGGSRTLFRTNANYTQSTVSVVVGSTIYVYASASWSQMGGTQLFPTSNNTTNFTVTINP